jgi:hypothetical protein
VRAIRRALLPAFALLLAGAPAAMAGPGITFYPKAGPVLELTGGQIAASANLPARTYTLPDDSETPGKKVTLRGLSISTLVARSGQSAQRVQVVKRNGGSTIVTPANFGTAMLSDDGITTRYIRSSGGVIVDYIESSDIKLEVSVDGGDLVVRAKANRKRVKEGESVTFEAGVFQGPPGATYSYEWDFGDPSGPVTGKRVPYRATLAGVLFAQVSVTNLDPDCTIRCNGTDQVEVEVGAVPDQPDATTQGGANGTPGGAGSSGAGGGGGSGSGAGGGGGAGTNPGGQETESPEPTEQAKPEPKPEPKPPPPPAKPYGKTISGVLINDTGTTARKLPAGEPAGAAEGVRAVQGGDTPGSIPMALGGLLAVAVMWVGALRERRAVKLRVA